MLLGFCLVLRKEAAPQGRPLGLAMVGAEGPPLGGRLKPRTARPPRSGGRPQTYLIRNKRIVRLGVIIGIKFKSGR